MTAGATQSGPRAARVARAVALSSIGTAAALTSHLVAGGSAPPVLGVIAVLVLSWPIAVPLAGRRLTAPQAAAVVAMSEAAFHLVFTVLASGPAAPLTVERSTMPGMSSPPLATAAATHAASGMDADPAMWVAHAVAAVLTWTLWLRGAAVLRGIARAAEQIVVALLRRPVVRPVAPPALPAAALDAPRARAASPRCTPFLRGPPLGPVQA